MADRLRLALDSSGWVLADGPARPRVFDLAALSQLPVGQALAVVASRRSIALVARLGERRDLDVRLAPSCWAAEDPEVELAALRQPCPDAPGPAWRRLTPALAAGYALAAAVDGDRPWAAQLAAHPAYGLFQRHHPARTAQFLAAVVDPGWYVCPDRAGRFSRLYAYLGLQPGRRHSILRRGRRQNCQALAAQADWLDGHSGLAGLRHYVAVIMRFWTGQTAPPHPEQEFFSPLLATGSAVNAARFLVAVAGSSAPRFDAPGSAR